MPNIMLRSFMKQILQIKDEFIKKEELYKIKLLNQEKINQSTSRANEEEISELRKEITKLKNNMDIIKRNNEEILESKKLSEEQYNTKLIFKEKENQKLSKLIEDLKQTISNTSLNSKNEISKKNMLSQQLKLKIQELTSNLSEIDSENANLIEALNQANTAVTQSEIEVEKRNNIIKGLMEENQQLLIQLQEKQNDFDDYQSSSQQEIERMREKIQEDEEEKENLMEQIQRQNNEINQFKEELIQNENNDNMILMEKQEEENKYNNLVKIFQIKEDEYKNEINDLSFLNNKLNKDIENLKNKYDKKIKVLKLQYDEASIRVNKLIHTCINYKQQILHLQRNLNINNNTNNSVNLGHHHNKFGNLFEEDLFNQTL